MRLSSLKVLKIPANMLLIFRIKYIYIRNGRNKSDFFPLVQEVAVSFHLPAGAVLHKVLLSSAAFKGELCCESSTTAVTLLCHADARLLNLSDSLTNPLQSSKSQPSNTV